MIKKRKYVSVSIPVSVEVRDWLQKIAKRDECSVSVAVRRMLREYIRGGMRP